MVRELALVGIYSGPSTTLYDGLPAVAGAHLRWSFRRELGFPRHGFTIQSLQGQWVELTRVTLPIFRPDYYPAAGRPFPDELAEAISRITFGFDAGSGEASALRNRYEPGLAGPRSASPPSAPPLIAMLDELLVNHGGRPLCQRLMPASGDGPQRTRLPIQDILLLASLDPYLARVLGLYYIHTSGTPGSRYRVIGHWGSEPWPLLRVDFGNVSPNLVRDNELAIDDLRILSPSGALRIPRNGAGEISITSEGSGPLLRVVLPYPVASTEFSLGEDGAAAGVRATTDGRTATVATSAGRLRVRAADGSPYSRLELSASVTSLRVLGIAYREEEGGGIGDLTSNEVAFVTPPPPVAVPMIARLRQGDTPLVLDAQGHAPAGQSQVEVSCIATTSTPEAMLRPVRLHVGRSNSPGVGPRIAPETVLTVADSAEHGPAVYGHPALVAALSMALVRDGSGAGRLAEERRFGDLPTVRGVSAFAPEYPGDSENAYFTFDATTFIEIPDRPDLQHLGDRLTLQLRLNPRPGMTTPTLIGNDWNESFWLGLIRHDANNYRARLWLKGTAGAVGPLHSSAAVTGLIQADKWNRLVVVYDGERVVFHVNGVEDVSHAAVIGVVRPNPAGVLRLGDDASATDARPAFPFCGEMADVRIWREALAPDEAERRFTDYSLPAGHYIDRGLSDGDYAYQVQGIDLFGRVSAWSAPRTIAVRDKVPPSPPVNVHAEYVPLTGRIIGTPEQITELVEIEATGTPAPMPPKTFEVRKWLVRTNLLFPRAHLGNLAARSGHHGGYDLTLSRPRSGDADRVDSQSFEILDAELDAAGRLVVTVREPPFAQLTPATRDAVLVAFDLKLRVSWGWTGLQRLFHSDTREFRFFLQSGPRNAVAGRVTEVLQTGIGVYRVETTITLTDAEAAALIGIPCQVGKHRYKIAGYISGSHIAFDLRYEARPTISPRPKEIITISLPERLQRDFALSTTWARRLDENIVSMVSAPAIEEPAAQLLQIVSPAALNLLRLGNEAHRVPPLAPWLPAPHTVREEGTDEERLISRVYVVSLADHAVPAQGSTSFVPGTLVGLDVAARPRAVWKLFPVLWHRRQAGKLALYVRHEAAPDAVDPPTVRLTLMRYYPGQRYEVTIDALPPEEMQRTAEQFIGVCAADGQRESSDARGNADRYGNESAVSPPVTVVAVNRRRPLEPPRPQVAIDHADYYGKSRATIFWDPLPSPDVTYQVYRAVDTALFTRDMLQRRLRLGHYKGKTEAEIMEDDLVPTPDFTDWLRVRFPDHFPHWERTLLPEVAGTDDEAYKAVNAVWRAWYERFYPALNNEELRELAMRNGNEGAFNVVSSSPVAETSYVDTVDGLVRNRYCYRLKSQSQALQESTAWGLVSDGVAPPKVKPPRAPVLSRVEPGDRSITLHWALNREPDLKGYRLYRAERAEDLEDLRWFGEGDDPRLIKDENELPDPRLLSVAGSVTVPGGAQIPCLDTGLGGAVDYFYRLVAVDAAGNSSEGSRVLHARCLEIAPPPAPRITIARLPDGAVDRITLTISSEPALQVMLQRMSAGDVAWSTVAGWQEGRDLHSWSELAAPWAEHRYRVWSRTARRLVSAEPDVFVALPRGS